MLNQNQNQNSGIIESHGMETMNFLFECSSLESLAQLRSKVLINKVVKSNSFVIPENLPPTKAGTNFHSFRMYFQIMLWSGYTPQGKAEKWGWYK